VDARVTSTPTKNDIAAYRSLFLARLQRCHTPRCLRVLDREFVGMTESPSHHGASSIVRVAAVGNITTELTGFVNDLFQLLVLHAERAPPVPTPCPSCTTSSMSSNSLSFMHNELHRFQLLVLHAQRALCVPTPCPSCTTSSMCSNSLSFMQNELTYADKTG